MFTENVLQNTPNCTIDNKSGVYAPIPLNIVCAVIPYLLFLYKKMNIFTFFFYKILAKKNLQNVPSCIIFFNFLGGVCPRTPLANVWLCHALHDASRHANTPTFPKTF